MSKPNDMPRKFMLQRIKVIIAGVVVCLLFITPGMLFYRQVVQYDFLSGKAIEQQTKDIIIPASRGTIYDRNLNELAVSADVVQIDIDPSLISEEKEEFVAENLANILELDYETVLKKVQKNSQYEIIKREVEIDVSEQVSAFALEYGQRGIIITPDTKRYYPQGELASNLLGFTGTDGEGLEGIERNYDTYLSGKSGRVISARDASGQEVGFGYDELIEPEDGNSLVLTIDEVVQYFLEKHIRTAQEDTGAHEGVSGIVMDVKTGEILAIANTPNYDPNSPFQIVDESALLRLYELGIESDKEIEQEVIDAEKEALEAFKEKYFAINGEVYDANDEDAIEPEIDTGISEQYISDKKAEARSTAQSAMLSKTWRSKTVVDSFEPGSIFKLFTVSVGLETGVIDPNYTFVCKGSTVVADRTINCVNKNGHGLQTLTQTLENSCNPAMIDISSKIGAETFYEYFKAYGFTEKTGVDLAGETSGIFFDEGDFNEVQLAVSSFGQTFQVTPLQLITAVSAIVNDGYMMQPHVVKEIVDNEGKIISTSSTDPVKQVVSEATSEFMREAMYSVVEVGGGRNAYVSGYRIGGKTSTSEKTTKNLQTDDGEKYYISSFIGVAPMDDPQIAVLISIDEPQGDTYFGGSIAAPVVARIMTDILPYMGVEAEYGESEMGNIDITTPSLVGTKAEDLKEKFTAYDIEYRTIGEGDEVTDQVPSPGSKIPSGSTMIVYLGGQKDNASIEVPNVEGMTVKQAQEAFESRGLFLKTTGISDAISSSGTTKAAMQSPKAGTKVVAGTVITVEFADKVNIVD